MVIQKALAYGKADSDPPPPLRARTKATKPGHVRSRASDVAADRNPPFHSAVGAKKEGVAFAVTPRRNIKPINYIFVFIVYVCFLRVYRAFFIGGRAEN